MILFLGEFKMKEKTIALNKIEITLIIQGLIMLGNDFAEKLEEAQKDENKTPMFSDEPRSLEEFAYETRLELIRELWEKIDPEEGDM